MRDELPLSQLEPNARTRQKALFSPTTATVDPKQVCRHIASTFPRNVRILSPRLSAPHPSPCIRR